MTQKDKVAEETAKEIKEEKRERQSPFAFSKCGISLERLLSFMRILILNVSLSMLRMWNTRGKFIR